MPSLLRVFAFARRSCGLFGLTVRSAVRWVVRGGVVFNAEFAECRKEREKFACGLGERELEWADCDESMGQDSRWM